MMTNPFESLPIAIVLWLVVYPADYYLTLYGQRLWLQNAKDILRFQGSYELNPVYQRDIDAKNWLSKRFIFMMLYGVVWMLFMWGATQYLRLPQVFPAAMGFLLLLEVVVLSTHFQNIRLFNAAATTGAVEGHISYARWVSMDGTAWKFAYWGVIFLIFALVTSNWFFAGGALSCLYEFLRWRQRSIRSRKSAQDAPS